MTSRNLLPLVDQGKLNNGLYVTFTDLKRVNNCRISGIPYRYLKEIPPSTRTLSRQKIGGDFFHDLLVEAEKCRVLETSRRFLEFHNYFESLVEKYSSKHADFLSRESQPLNDWGEINASFQTVERILASPLKPGAEILREEELFARERTLFGIIDELFIEGDQMIIRDYKLRRSSQAMKGDPTFPEQLHFYLLLVEENFPNKTVNALELVGLNQTRLKVPFDESIYASVLSKAKRQVNFLRKLTVEDPTARDLCSGCEKCSWYWEDQKSL